MNRQRESAARRAFDATEPGSCKNPLCPRPHGPHGWCLAHSCGDPVPESKVVCRLQADHGGHWHDSGSLCWLVEETFTGPDPGADWKLLIEAVEFVLSGRLAQTSTLQRGMRIGYAKAAQLLQLMEDWGIVGPRVGSMARDVLAHADMFDDIAAAIRATQEGSREAPGA